jgi:hypothetical protein
MKGKKSGIYNIHFHNYSFISIFLGTFQKHITGLGCGSNSRSQPAFYEKTTKK